MIVLSDHRGKIIVKLINLRLAVGEAAICEIAAGSCWGGLLHSQEWLCYWCVANIAPRYRVAGCRRLHPRFLCGGFLLALRWPITRVSAATVIEVIQAGVVFCVLAQMYTPIKGHQAAKNAVSYVIWQGERRVANSRGGGFSEIGGDSVRRSCRRKSPGSRRAAPGADVFGFGASSAATIN